MPRRPRVKTFMDSQHVKGSERVPKSSQQCFGHIFWSLWTKISSKSPVLVVSEIFKLFVNILTPNESFLYELKLVFDVTNSNAIIS